MTKPNRFLDGDPPRWIDRPPGGAPEDRAAARLRGALPLALPPISWRAERSASLRELGRLRLSFALAAAFFLSAGVGIGVASTSYGWFARKPPRGAGAEQIEVPAGSVTRLRRAGRWRAALTGPAAASVGADGEVRLTSGTITIAAEGAGAAAAVADARVRLEQGAIARLDLDGDGRPGLVVVDGVVEAGGARARAATDQDRADARHALDPSAAVAVPPPPAEVLAPPPPLSVRAPTDDIAKRGQPHARGAAPAAAPREASAGVVPAPVEAPPLVESADSESASLAAALTALRREKNADAALALVEQSLARHPDGALVPEMVAVRVEALLARGDAAQALAALDALPTARVPLDRRLRAVRGELRANAGRCDEAAADFSATLRAAPADAVDERALRGRASCEAILHDEAALRADLELYVRQFPDRPFAPEARRRLETP